MIAHRTFRDLHRWHLGGRALDKQEALRQQAEAFVDGHLNEEDLICITESSNEYASSVTVWYWDR